MRIVIAYLDVEVCAIKRQTQPDRAILRTRMHERVADKFVYNEYGRVRVGKRSVGHREKTAHEYPRLASTPGVVGQPQISSQPIDYSSAFFSSRPSGEFETLDQLPTWTSWT